jgi:hypothetical protein
MHDDALFVRLANNIANGLWLGPYDSLTLAKGPGYPLWIALNFFTNLPLHVLDHAAYIGACTLFVVAVATNLPNTTSCLVLFGLLVFNPMSFGFETLRYTRDFLYTSQTLSVMACLFGLFLRLDGSLAKVACWSMGLGLSFGFFWITREEGIVIVPTVAIVYALIGYRLWRSRSLRKLQRVIVLSLPFFIAATVIYTIAATNYMFYGVLTTTEFKSTEFNAAYGAITRVSHSLPHRLIPVPKETRERIYVFSPAFRELQPYLEGTYGQQWTYKGKEGPQASDLALKNEILGGWFVWAFRQAVELAGHYSSAPEAMSFYSRIASEVNAACNAGLLACGPPRATLAPPWRWEYLAPVPILVWEGFSRIVTIDGFLPTGIASMGSEEQLFPFYVMSSDLISPIAGKVIRPSVRTRLNSIKIRCLNGIGSIYRTTAPFLAVVSISLLLLSAVIRSVRQHSRFLFTSLLILLTVAARLLLLAYIQITSVRALHPLYMLALYPLLIAFCVITITDALNSLVFLTRSPSRT